MVTIDIPGVPQQQGSKNQWGAEDNPRVRGWRQHVADKALEALDGEPPLDGPVKVDVLFVFPRPKSHYHTGKNAGRLRFSAPTYHTSVPDLDKLQRAVGDALSAVVIRDDRQIACWSVVKLYGDNPGAQILVRPL